MLHAADASRPAAAARARITGAILRRGAGLLALALLACSPPPDEGTPVGGEERDLAFFLRRLRELDHLPRLEPGHTALASTWDRKGGNLDADDFKGIDGDRNVLLDVAGPGCVHRVFTGLLGAHFKQTRIQIFIDDAATPLLDLPVNTFMSGQLGPFPYPLTTAKTYPGTHFPLPFARRIRIQLTSAPGPADRWGVYWQLTYSTYPAGTAVKSLTWPPDARAREELGRTQLAWLQASLPPQEPDRWQVDRALALGPGQQQQIALQGSGVIEQLRVQVSPATPAALRKLRLRMSWDGAAAPSVDVPLGYFFGHGDSADQDVEFNSLHMGGGGGAGYTRIPMPFSAGAQISLVNAADAGAVTARLRLAVRAYPSGLPQGLGRFHVTWTQRLAALPSAPTFGPQGIPGHVVLDRAGRGKYVGTLVHLQWPHPVAWWGEGDWLIWSDESAWPPSYHGTGSEEYFNAGFTFFDRKPVSGFITVRPGPVAVYSFHLNDAFSFEQRIKVVEETVGSLGGQAIIDQQQTLWGTTAYWYALPAQPAGSTP